MQYNRVMLGRGGMYAEECRKNGYDSRQNTTIATMDTISTGIT